MVKLAREEYIFNLPGKMLDPFGDTIFSDEPLDGGNATLLPTVGVSTPLGTPSLFGSASSLVSEVTGGGANNLTEKEFRALSVGESSEFCLWCCG